MRKSSFINPSFLDKLLLFINFGCHPFSPFLLFLSNTGSTYRTYLRYLPNLYLPYERGETFVSFPLPTTGNFFVPLPLAPPFPPHLSPRRSLHTHNMIVHCSS
jgi:hypothetical protein